MKNRIGRLSFFTLISLLSLFSFSSPAGTQDNVVARPSELGRRTGVTPKAAGQFGSIDYDYRVLYNFCSAPNCTDGAAPQAGLVEDATGNLFGTTTAGGDNSSTSCGSNGCGTVFKVDNTGHETVLYSFCSAPNCADGAAPQAGLIEDAAGNLYGTTMSGGANANPDCSKGCGTVFKVDNSGRETVLYSFCSITPAQDSPPCLDGSSPQAGLIQDAAGNFYGTTKFGGPGNGGTVFKLDNTGHETVIDGFCEIEPNCPDGAAPEAGLIQDAAGSELFRWCGPTSGTDPGCNGQSIRHYNHWGCQRKRWHGIQGYSHPNYHRYSGECGLWSQRYLDDHRDPRDNLHWQCGSDGCGDIQPSRRSRSPYVELRFDQPGEYYRRVRWNRQPYHHHHSRDERGPRKSKVPNSRRLYRLRHGPRLRHAHRPPGAPPVQAHPARYHLSATDLLFATDPHWRVYCVRRWWKQWWRR